VERTVCLRICRVGLTAESAVLVAAWLLAELADAPDVDVRVDGPDAVVVDIGNQTEAAPIVSAALRESRFDGWELTPR